MDFRRGLLSIALGSISASCGGGAKQIEMTPIPARESSGNFAGATCQTAECTCRSGDADGGVGFPTDGRKRFEIRITSPYELWASGPGVRMYKDKEKPDKCFYVDLETGEHTFSMRASNPNGAAAQIKIQELGTDTKAWYETFDWRCGNPGACSFDELDANKAALNTATNKNLYDKCGSVKVKNVVWDTGKSPDQQYPSELLVQFTLDIYKFKPEWQPGDPSCGKRKPKAPSGGSAEPEPTVTPAGSDSATP